MKKIISLLLVSSFVFPSVLLAAGAKDRECVECILKTNAAAEQKITRVCNDVSDIICKDVKAEERRGCSESDEYMFSKNTSKMDIYNFAKGCFKSGVKSFAQFFTDFIPELLKGIWEATKSVGKLAVKSVSGDEPGLWSKLKGMYESTTSVAADIYEAVQENPGAYFDKIWSKVVDVVGPMVAGYDCLKPQLKVEKVCGFVAEWVVPPAMLAKILVRGIKEVKFLKETGAFSATTSGKLAKALEFSEKRSVLSLKQLQKMEGEFKALGYTSDEFALLYKTGALEKINVAELKALTTAEGKLQKAKLLGEPKVTVTTATATAVPKPAPKKPDPVKPVALTLSSDFITTTKTGLKGEKLVGNGQIVERIITNGEETAFKVRMVEEGTGRTFEMVYSKADLAAMNAKNASQSAAEKITDAIAKDDAKLAALKKKELPHEKPDDLKMLEVNEGDLNEFMALQKAQKEAEAKQYADHAAAIKRLDAPPGQPVKVDGMDVHAGTLDDFHAAQAEQKAIAQKKIKDAEVAESKRIKEQGVVQHDGMAVEEIHPDDPRFKALMNDGKKHEYVGGIDYTPTEAPGQIIRAKDTRKPTVIKGEGKAINGPFQSDYIQVTAKNSMGMTTFMPAQIVKKVVEDGQQKFVIRILDKTSNAYKEKTVSLSELKLQYKAKEAAKVEGEIKDFNRATGFHDDLTP